MRVGIMFQRWSDAGGEVRCILCSMESHEGEFLKTNVQIMYEMYKK